MDERIRIYYYKVLCTCDMLSTKVKSGPNCLSFDF